MLPYSLLWSKPALITYACIALVLGYVAWHHHVYQQGYDMAIAEQTQAAANLKAKAANAAITAVTGVINANITDAPAVDLAANGVRNACRGLRSAPGARGADEANAEAEVRRTLSDAAEDIKTCQAAINQCSGLQVERLAITTSK